MYTKETLRKMFQSPFDKGVWNDVVKNLFMADELLLSPDLVTDVADCDKGFYLGALNTSDNYRIGLFLYEVNSTVLRKRVGLRNLVRSFINPRWGEFDAAVVVFSDGALWRLSFVCDIKGENTAPKRYTFVFGESGLLYRTAVERFLMLQERGASFATLMEVFSVEAISKEFFAQYSAIYDRFCDHAYEYKNNPLFFDFAKYSEKEIRDYVKLLLGRVVFLCFVQKKGWLNADPHFLHNIFQCYCEQVEPGGDEFRFLDGVLEPLFFECLNIPHGDSYQTIVKNYGEKGRISAPYLNGGLFEQKEIDIPKSVFGKTLWGELFHLLSNYNFTIDENDPNDAEVGIDPEMLGKIFESQLEDNKDKGAFYTPKEIVQYMCRESVDAYLKANVNRGKDELTLLKEIKVCDPAIGSGAFPMGMLRELCLRRQTLGDDTDIVQMKKEIVQNNIYGVDIEAGAVDIARLRFWLSIVVDSDNPEPLPNLDFKIMQGNSLLEQYKGADLSKLTERKSAQEGGSCFTLFDDLADVHRDKLNQLISTYYSLHENKAQLREEIKQNVVGQLHAAHIKAAVVAELEQIDLHANTHFFLWHTWFKDVFDKGGFDVVIGNPPYIQLQGNGGLLGELYKGAGFKTFERTGDIYSLFYEKGVSILKANAHLCYITSNKWMRAGYGESTRGFFAEQNPKLLIDFAGVKIFENATVDVNILLMQKAKNEGQTRACVTKDKECLTNLGDYIQHSSSLCAFASSDSWVILSPIEMSIKRKIEAVGTPLKEWDIQINYGIKTGCNEAFIISTEKREEILLNCQSEEERRRTEEIIRPFCSSQKCIDISCQCVSVHLAYLCNLSLRDSLL